MADKPLYAFDHVTLEGLTGHIASVAAIVGTLIGIFPSLAACAAFIWYCIVIYESKPVQKWIRRRRMHRRKRFHRRRATV